MDKKRSPLRSPGILLVALVVLIAATGLVYAHWTTTLRVDANVNTGNVYAEWLDTSTNDDGNPNNGDGENAASPAYDDMWGPESSADPSNTAWNAARYDKDVARCASYIEGDTLSINVDNAYPSYHCGVQGELANKGSIPLRVTAITPNAGYENRCGFWETDSWDGENPGVLYEGPMGWDEGGPFADLNGNGERDAGEYDVYQDCRSGAMSFVPGANPGNFALEFQDVAEIEGDIALGLDCGLQIDPMACQWITVDDPTTLGNEAGEVWNGHVDWCNQYDNDERQCAFNEDGTYYQAVEQACEGATYAANGWFHVLQEADQGTNYHWSFEQEFVNWNEWDASMCTEGAVIVNPDGTPFIP